jgi:hypothetical protein
MNDRSTDIQEAGKRLRQAVLWSLYFVCHWTGVFRIFYSLRRRRTLIVGYHNIIPDELFDGSIHLGAGHRASEFQRQIAHIASRFEIITDFSASGAGKCIVTFDDGYANNIGAAEYLTELGARGVFFVPVEPILTGRTLVIDQVLLWFSYVPQGNYVLAGESVSIADDRRAEAYSQFYQWMLTHVELWNTVPDSLDASYPFSKLPAPKMLYEIRFRPMNADELKRLTANGHSVGCHSWDHRPLAALSDQELQKDFENCESQRWIFNTNTYCYPFGGPLEVDGRVMRQCEAFGYEYGAVYTFTEGNNVNPFALPRLSLPPKLSRYSLDAKLSGFESAIKSVLGRS